MKLRTPNLKSAKLKLIFEFLVKQNVVVANSYCDVTTNIFNEQTKEACLFRSICNKSETMKHQLRYTNNFAN